MLANNGYYEMSLWNNHVLQVWVEGRLCILKHPKCCNKEDDSCREKLMKYIHKEGILDELLDKKIIMLDSYIEDFDE